MRKAFDPSRSWWRAGALAAPAFASALLAAGTAAAQSSLIWGIEEKASRGCVADVSLAFDDGAALAGHAPQPLCGSTAVRLYPEPVPAGRLTVSFKNQRGEPFRYTIPLAAVFRRENVRMEQSVLQLVYGQDSLEVWLRPLADSGAGAARTRPAPDEKLTPIRIFFGGLQLDAAPPPPGISRSR